MEEFRIYAAGVIFSALAAGVVFILLPSKRVAKPVRIAASVAVLTVMLAPLLKISHDFDSISANAEITPPEYYSELKTTQKAQQTEVIKDNFSASVKEILASNGIIPSDVHIYVTEENESTVLYDIGVTLGADATAADRNKTKRIVTEVFGIEPSIETER